MPDIPDIQIDLDELNHTELVQLARWVGIAQASRSMEREVLTKALNNLEPIEEGNPVDARRDAMSAWLNLHWGRLQMQAPKAACPFCYTCSDMQAMECYHNNKQHFGGG